MLVGERLHKSVPREHPALVVANFESEHKREERKAMEMMLGFRKYLDLVRWRRRPESVYMGP